jgi:hypothetical protein
MNNVCSTSTNWPTCMRVIHVCSSSLIERLILEGTRTPGLLRVLRGAAQGERYLRDLRKRVLQLLADPLEAAKAAGLVRANVQLDDVPIIFAMLEGPVEEAATSGRPEVALRALELVFQGIAQRGRRRKG